MLKGDITEAICTHAVYYAIWKKYEAMPERFNWQTKQSEVHFSPLRPELIESTYLLHQVSLTKGSFLQSHFSLRFTFCGVEPTTSYLLVQVASIIEL